MESVQMGTVSMEAVRDGSSPSGGSATESPTVTDLPAVAHPPPQSPPISSTGTGSKRKKTEEEGAEREENGSAPLHNPLWKTNLCSFFRRRSQSCSHGDKCRYAHGEEELRPRPDNSWDPTSERAKKLLVLALKSLFVTRKQKKLSSGRTSALQHRLEESSSEAGLSAFNRCLVHLPKKWTSENLKSFLDSEGILYGSARKKKGMIVAFACFSSLEQVLHATEKLDGKPMGNKHVKVADVILRSGDTAFIKSY